jgi:SAM-dependent methyltransferase
MHEAWIMYLKQVSAQNQKTRMKYKYPVSDQTTDSRLLIQDPNKLDVEQLLFLQFLERTWRTAIDFGCGTGANFMLFDGENRKDCLLIGIDPDCERIKKAQLRATNQLQWIQSQIICGGIEIIEEASPRLQIDIILCSQVLGHVSTTQAQRIINGFNKILDSKGCCCLAFPVVGTGFMEDPTSGDWNGEEDFTHLVNMKFSPGDLQYRTHITLDEFDNYTEHPVRGKLPVRAFFLPDFPVPSAKKLPIRLETPPPTIARLFQNQFQIENLVLYSIHKDYEDVTYPIGDLIMVLQKSNTP